MNHRKLSIAANRVILLLKSGPVEHFVRMWATPRYSDWHVNLYRLVSKLTILIRHMLVLRLIIKFSRRLLAVTGLFCYSWGGSAQPSSSVVPPYFSHCFTVVDSVTFQAINESPFLKDTFAFTTTITSSVDAGKITYSGKYLFGKQTYLEFFVQDQKQLRRACGLGLQLEKPGQLKTLYNSLHNQFDFSYGPRTRKAKDGSEFLYAYKSYIYGNERDSGQFFSSWIMEFDTTYIKSKFNQKYLNDITRETFQQNRFNKELSLQDIRSLTVALSKRDKQHFITISKALGYRIKRYGAITLILGSGISILVKEATNKLRGISKIEMRLTKPKIGQLKYYLGHSILEFKRKQAVWLFDTY